MIIEAAIGVTAFVIGARWGFYLGVKNSVKMMLSKDDTAFRDMIERAQERIGVMARSEQHAKSARAYVDRLYKADQKGD